MIKGVTHVDIGCGMRKKDGYYGIDISSYDRVDLVQDLRFTPLPFADESVTDVYASHFLEHLSFEEVLFLFNEVYRVMVVGGKFEIIVPHAMSYGYFTDLSHKTPWVEDTFGYFTPDNKYFYEWHYMYNNERRHIINKWKVLKNDNTPPFRYTIDGWVEVKLREVHAVLEKLP